MASGFMNCVRMVLFSGKCHLFTSLSFTGPAGGVDDGHPPLSALPDAIKGSGLGMTLWLVAMAFVLYLLLGGINYIATKLLTTQGMSFTKMPLTIGPIFFTAIRVPFFPV